MNVKYFSKKNVKLSKQLENIMENNFLGPMPFPLPAVGAVLVQLLPTGELLVAVPAGAGVNA